jgi:hypothetical protein
VHTQATRPTTATGAPVVLTESPPPHSPRPPLWVGAAVGISGGLGLAFSAVSWRRRSGAGGPAGGGAAGADDTDVLEEIEVG